MTALAVVEAEIDRLEALLAGLHHAAELLRNTDLAAAADGVAPPVTAARRPGVLAAANTDDVEDRAVVEVFECDLCDRTFDKPHGLRMHKLRSHKEEAKVMSFDPDAARARAAEAM